MNLFKIVLKVFKTNVSQGKSWNVLNFAFKAYEQACAQTAEYTIRANRLHEIFLADIALSKAPGCPAANAAYDAAVSKFKDSPGDFHAYTRDEIDAHAATINSLTLSFESINAAFDSVIKSENEELYNAAIGYMKSNCELYTLAASAYSQAAFCALHTALEDNIQVTKDEFECILLERRADSASQVEATAARNLAIRFRTMVTEKAAKAKALEVAARTAVADARMIESKAESAGTRIAVAVREITTKA